MNDEIKDAIGQPIYNGDLVVCASKSADNMIFRVMKDVKHQTAVRIDKSYDYRTKQEKWIPADKSSRLYTLARTLKVPDEIFVKMNPDLFQIMVEVRKKLSLPTNSNVQSLDALRRMLQNF